jgi:uncharacterized membrane protein YhaH (DUF805 family)
MSRLSCRLTNHRLEDEMNFVDAVKTCFTKYVGFEGRATRSEYWWWVLFIVAVSIVMAVLNLGMIGNLFSLTTLLPSIAVGTRRLHDIGKSGWWQLIALIPLIGWLVLIYWAVQPSEGDNAFGPVPTR